MPFCCRIRALDCPSEETTLTFEMLARSITSCRIQIQVLAAALFLWSFGVNGLAADAHLGNMKATKVLFLGNSICIVPRSPTPPNDYGASASTPEKDYVHLLAKRIEARTNSKLRLVPTNNTIKNPDGSTVTGDANIVNIADIFERGYATYSADRLKKQIAWQPDIVVLQFGENIPHEKYDAVVFKQSLQRLVADLKNSSNPHIFFTGYILGANPAIDDIKRQVCAEDPTHRFFVDLSSVWHDPANHGELGHPNDQGMAMLADLLFRAMETHATLQEKK